MTEAEGKVAMRARGGGPRPRQPCPVENERGAVQQLSWSVAAVRRGRAEEDEGCGAAGVVSIHVPNGPKPCGATSEGGAAAGTGRA